MDRLTRRRLRLSRVRRRGGSMQPMLVSQCMTDKSVERESFLASLLQCEDGDQSCPLPPAN